MKLLKDSQAECLRYYNEKNNTSLKEERVDWGFDSRRYPNNVVTLLCLIQNGEVVAKFDMFGGLTMYMD